MCQSTAIAGKVKQSPKCGDLVSCNTLGRHTGIVVEIIEARAYTKALYIVMIDGERSFQWVPTEEQAKELAEGEV